MSSQTHLTVAVAAAQDSAATGFYLRGSAGLSFVTFEPSARTAWHTHPAPPGTRS